MCPSLLSHGRVSILSPRADRPHRTSHSSPGRASEDTHHRSDRRQGTRQIACASSTRGERSPAERFVSGASANTADTSPPVDLQSLPVAPSRFTSLWSPHRNTALEEKLQIALDSTGSPCRRSGRPKRRLRSDCQFATQRRSRKARRNRRRDPSTGGPRYPSRCLFRLLMITRSEHRDCPFGR